MTTTVVAMVTIAEDQPAALAKYFETTSPLLEKAGAKITKRFVVNEAVVGKSPAQTVIIVEYPDRAAVDMVFGSQEYKDITDIRDIAFTDYHITVVDNQD